MPLSIESWIGQKFIAITYYKKVSFHLLKNDKNASSGRPRKRKPADL
jgi:hypothetical protein